MKSVLQAGWLLTVAVGNIIVLIVAGAGQIKEQVGVGEESYLCLICLWSSGWPFPAISIYTVISVSGWIKLPDQPDGEVTKWSYGQVRRDSSHFHWVLLKSNNQNNQIELTYIHPDAVCYQRKGLSWLLWMQCNGPKRGMLSRNWHYS